MPSHAAAERAALVAALQAVPPAAPTLCEGWTALDLAAHVVARERRLDSMPGLLVPAFARWTDRVRQAYAARPYPDLIQLIASGPPALSPFAIPAVDSSVNLVEFLVHTEDIRRAQPDWAPRDVPAALHDAVWAGLARSARLLYRKSPVGVVLATPDGRRLTAASRPGTAEQVIVTGEPVELQLYTSGRATHAQVELTGPDDALARFRQLKLGI